MVQARAETKISKRMKTVTRPQGGDVRFSRQLAIQDLECQMEDSSGGRKEPLQVPG
jgi:hypothetical protein